MRDTVRASYLQRRAGTKAVPPSQGAADTDDLCCVEAEEWLQLVTKGHRLVGTAAPKYVGTRGLVGVLSARLAGDCEALRRAVSGIRALQLNCCEVGDEGVCALAAAAAATEGPTLMFLLAESRTLANVDLAWNCVTDGGVRALCALLACFAGSVASVNAAHNHLSERGTAAVCDFVCDPAAGALATVHLGVEHLGRPAVRKMGAVLAQRRERHDAPRVAAEKAELVDSMETYRRRMGELQTERDTVAAKETRYRREIEAAQADDVRSLMKRKNTFLQSERLRLKDQVEVRRQRTKEERQDLEEDEASRRAGVRREETTERKHLEFSESNGQQRLKVSLQYRRKQAHLVDLKREFVDMMSKAEAKQRGEFAAHFHKGMEACRGRERRRVQTKEREYRERCGKKQEEERKGLAKLFKTELKRCGAGGGKVDRAKAEAARRNDKLAAEAARRSSIVSLEHQLRTELLLLERGERKAAKEQTIEADRAAGGILRVLGRKAAHVRLEICDQQEAERQQLYVGYRLDVPAARADPGREEMMERLRQQQGEEFAARARERSVLLIEDWSVLNFDNFEELCHANVHNSSFRASFVTVPSKSSM